MSLISEDACVKVGHDPVHLANLCQHYWNCEGKKILNRYGISICELATDFFISMKVPSADPFKFGFDLRKDPQALLFDTLKIINKSDGIPEIINCQYYVTRYVFIVCYLALNDNHFWAKATKAFSMQQTRMTRLIHQYSKLLKVWGKKAHLSRLDPLVIKKIMKRKVGEVDAIASVLDTLLTSISTD
ncbi:hypothetical protein DSO57_1031455 [Entomophthora muscae]|uniref:Uncharacterized protein n=1 Tax=Entomophthora muscae TaxID=34485 RepID=A0ACC2ULG0_9FUNG|nr:hypothetical protein DSO57_1031455 [Entomophthora muscae]